MYENVKHRLDFLNGLDQPLNYFLKRLTDYLGAIVLLIFFAIPVLIIIALIKMGSRGPVIYQHQRVGRNGRPFMCYKFRTMYLDANVRLNELLKRDPAAAREWEKYRKLWNDPRITLIGRFLRATSLDELPQLWNILVGNMSFVGPRPLPPDELEVNQWWQRRRLSMPPGLTCYWQVKGSHSMPFREWMELDLKYIDSWSLWIDMRLILLTFHTLARASGW
jgi:lipopolysaccharide/colanic/teichoic acid biosynthesis glycosyltransferase